MFARAVLFMAGAMLLACTTSCSLVSFKSLDRPLSTQDMNSRVLTREYADGFRASVEQCADEIMAIESDSIVKTSALRWKVAATSESQRAAMRQSPLMALLDTWAFSTQMRSFFGDQGHGRELFGTRQAIVRSVADRLEADIVTIARRLVPAEDFARYGQFVRAYAVAHPLTDLHFVRASVVEAWSRESGSELKLVDSMGTISEVTADLAQRMQIYSDSTPTQLMWQTQLALRQSGYGGSDVKSALEVLDRRLEALSLAVDATPERVHIAVQDVRASAIDVIDRLAVAAASMVEALQLERLALAENVRLEREALTGAMDVQRKAIAIDASLLADRVVTSYGEQARLLVRETLLRLIIFAALVLTLPFAAGYLVGRVRR